MAHPNAEMLKRGYDAFAQGDIETFTSTWHDDIVFHVRSHDQLSGDYRGKEQALGFLGREMEMADSVRVEMVDMAASDEYGFVVFNGIAERGGKSVNEPLMNVHRIENQKVAEIWVLPFNPAVVDDFWS